MKLNSRHRIHYRSRPWFPFLLLGFGIVGTLILAYYVDYVADTKDKLLLDKSATQIKEVIERRMDSYIALLRSGAGLFATQQEITQSEFKHYTALLGLSTRYKGVQGLGYSMRISPDQIDEVSAYMQAQGVINFSIHPVHPRGEYHAIIYLEPENVRNNAAIGYDMFSEPIRRAAMEQARDMGRPVTSGKVTLVQEIDQNKQTGFLMYMPVYDGYEVPETVEERRKLLRGFVYSPFRTGDLFTTILGTQKGDVDIYIYDGDSLDESALLYSRTGKPVPVGLTKKSLAQKLTTTFARRTWTLYIVPTSNFINSYERTMLPFILIGGFTISFILYLLSRWQYMSRLSAEHFATELFQSKIALEASEARLRRIIDANIFGVAFVRLDGTVNDANDAYLKLIGYTRNDLRKGINFLDITPPEYRKLDKQAMREIRQKGTHKPFEKEYIRKDGARVSVLIGTAYLKGSKDEAIKLVIDLTDRKRLERQKDEFISIASHELKTPVTSLKAYAQVLAKRLTKKGDTESAKHLEKMDNQLDKLTNLIKDLLDITKIEAGKLQFQNNYFDLNLLVKEIVEEMQRTTEQHEIIIKGSVKRKLFGDNERIGQVLVNLLSNAIKYSPQANKVIVALEQNTETATVCVQDFGVGIPKQMQTKVFDRFFRGSDTRVQTFPGLGLGLFISAEIIKRQKGKIWVESEETKGSSFYFSLPLDSHKKNGSK